MFAIIVLIFIFNIAPIYLHVTEIYPNSLTLSWRDGFNIKPNQKISYKVKELNEFKDSEYIAQTQASSNKNTLQISNIKSDTKYSFIMLACDEDTKDESSLSEPLTITTPDFKSLVLYFYVLIFICFSVFCFECSQCTD